MKRLLLLSFSIEKDGKIIDGGNSYFKSVAQLKSQLVETYGDLLPFTLKIQGDHLETLNMIRNGKS